MRTRALLLIVAGLWIAAPAIAEPPPYLLLRVPAKPLTQPSHHHPHYSSYNRYPGTERHVSTHAYSYGWFGVQPRQHWSRHFGYYRNYTQWSGK